MRLLSLAILWFGLPAPIVAQEPPVGPSRDVGKTPIPDWVEQYAIDMNRAAPQSDVGSTWTLLDDWQYDSRTRSTFHRYAYRFMSETGVQEHAQLEFEFDPTYERLRIHRLVIHRDGRAIDRLPAQSFRVIEREARHERQIYDRRLSVLAVMEDIRVGDTLEYAMSRVGANPVLRGRFATSLYTCFSVPLAHLRIRIRWHEPQPLTIRKHGTTLEPTIRRQGGVTEYFWADNDVSAVLPDGEIPHTYQPWGTLRISEWPDWASVAAWAEEQYVIPKTLPDPLEELVDRIEGFRYDEERVAAALRWVQDKYRYVGMVEGVHAHRPHDLETICRRRFGDCKDKALLLTAVLRRLGYEASPALVNTDRRESIADWPPSPHAFDHLIVNVVVDERAYWLDPTRAYQRGGLRDIYLPDYGYALVVRPGEKTLTAIGVRDDIPCGVFITETISMKDFGGDATLTVKTVYVGRDADRVRASLAEQNRAAIEKNYLSYYGRTYPKIEKADPIDVEDDDGRNRITIRESYRIRELWEVSPDEPDRIQMSLSADTIGSELVTPDTKVRTMPFAVRHPVRMDQTIVVRFPVDIGLEADETKVTNPAFRFELKEKPQGKRHYLRYRYRSRRDKVEVSDVPRFLKDVARAHDNIGMTVWVPKSYRDHPPAPGEARGAPPPFQPNGPVILLALVVLALAAVAAIFVGRWKPSYSPPRLPRKTPSGIRGWLILPAIGVVLSPLISIVCMFSMLVESTSMPNWTALTTPGASNYHPLWEPVLLADTVCLAALLVFDVLIFVLFFRKWYTLPRLYVAWLAINVLCAGVFYFLYAAIPNVDPEIPPQYLKDLVRGVIGMSIWASYFMVSKRVKATFVRGVPRKQIAPAADSEPEASPPPEPEAEKEKGA